jgi:hypothetical protein
MAKGQRQPLPSFSRPELLAIAAQDGSLLDAERDKTTLEAVAAQLDRFKFPASRAAQRVLVNYAQTLGLDQDDLAALAAGDAVPACPLDHALNVRLAQANFELIELRDALAEALLTEHLHLRCSAEGQPDAKPELQPFTPLDHHRHALRSALWVDWTPAQLEGTAPHPVLEALIDCYLKDPSLAVQALLEQAEAFDTGYLGRFWQSNRRNTIRSTSREPLLQPWSGPPQRAWRKQMLEAFASCPERPERLQVMEALLELKAPPDSPSHGPLVTCLNPGYLWTVRTLVPSFRTDVEADLRARKRARGRELGLFISEGLTIRTAREQSLARGEDFLSPPELLVCTPFQLWRTKAWHRTANRGYSLEPDHYRWGLGRNRKTDDQVKPPRFYSSRNTYKPTGRPPGKTPLTPAQKDANAQARAEERARKGQLRRPYKGVPGAGTYYESRPEGLRRLKRMHERMVQQGYRWSLEELIAQEDEKGTLPPAPAYQLPGPPPSEVLARELQELQEQQAQGQQGQGKAPLHKALSLIGAAEAQHGPACWSEAQRGGQALYPLLQALLDPSQDDQAVQRYCDERQKAVELRVSLWGPLGGGGGAGGVDPRSEGLRAWAQNLPEAARTELLLKGAGAGAAAGAEAKAETEAGSRGHELLSEVARLRARHQQLTQALDELVRRHAPDEELDQAEAEADQAWDHLQEAEAALGEAKAAAEARADEGGGDRAESALPGTVNRAELLARYGWLAPEYAWALAAALQRAKGAKALVGDKRSIPENRIPERFWRA